MDLYTIFGMKSPPFGARSHEESKPSGQRDLASPILAHVTWKNSPITFHSDSPSARNRSTTLSIMSTVKLMKEDIIRYVQESVDSLLNRQP